MHIIPKLNMTNLSMLSILLNLLFQAKYTEKLLDSSALRLALHIHNHCIESRSTHAIKCQTKNVVFATI